MSAVIVGYARTPFVKFTGAFAAILKRPMRLVGARALRGVEKPVELFTPTL